MRNADFKAGLSRSGPKATCPTTSATSSGGRTPRKTWRKWSVSSERSGNDSVVNGRWRPQSDCLPERQPKRVSALMGEPPEPGPSYHLAGLSVATALVELVDDGAGDKVVIRLGRRFTDWQRHSFGRRCEPGCHSRVPTAFSSSTPMAACSPRPPTQAATGCNASATALQPRRTAPSCGSQASRPIVLRPSDRTEGRGRTRGVLSRIVDIYVLSRWTNSGQHLEGIHTPSRASASSGISNPKLQRL